MKLDQVVYWIKERERIRIRKEANEPFPWTSDPILCSLRFCNVRREDDKVTRWIDRHIRRSYKDHQHLWFMLCIARVINWPPTMSDLKCTRTLDGEGWPDDSEFTMEKFAMVLEGRAKRGEKVFTGAYTITAPPEKGASKIQFIAEHTLGKLWEDRKRFEQHFQKNPTFQSTFKLLTEYIGWGPFMAYQVIIDLRFTRYLCDAGDINTWAAAGPGTLRGLNRVFGRLYHAPLKQEQALSELIQIRPLIMKETGMPFELSEITGIMCETDKYARIKNKEGKLRSNYIPEPNYVQGGFL